MKTYLFLFAFSVISLFAQAQLTADMKTSLIDRHNYYRQIQNAPNVTWSDDLAADAQVWADKIAKKDQLIHSDMQWGENIYWSSDYSTPQHVVDVWASEQKYYNGEKITNQNYSLFGHYTQVIWAETTQIGCAYAISRKGGYYWVCEYNPAGNYIGEKPVDNYK